MNDVANGNQAFQVDRAFLREVQERSCNGGLEWCEKHGIERGALIETTSQTAVIAAKEDAGLTSYGVAMFKLGYETRFAQEELS